MSLVGERSAAAPIQESPEQKTRRPAPNLLPNHLTPAEGKGGPSWHPLARQHLLLVQKARGRSYPLASVAWAGEECLEWILRRFLLSETFFLIIVNSLFELYAFDFRTFFRRCVVPSCAVAAASTWPTRVDTLNTGAAESPAKAS